MNNALSLNIYISNYYVQINQSNYNTSNEEEDLTLVIVNNYLEECL